MARTGSGGIDVTMRSTGERTDVEMGSEGIAIVVPRGDYRVDASSGSGRVTVANLVQDPQAARRITARIGSGNVTITGR